MVLSRMLYVNFLAFALLITLGCEKRNGRKNLINAKSPNDVQATIMIGKSKFGDGFETTLKKQFVGPFFVQADDGTLAMFSIAESVDLGLKKCVPFVFIVDKAEQSVVEARMKFFTVQGMDLNTSFELWFGNSPKEASLFLEHAFFLYPGKPPSYGESLDFYSSEINNSESLRFDTKNGRVFRLSQISASEIQVEQLAVDPFTAEDFLAIYDLRKDSAKFVVDWWARAKKQGSVEQAATMLGYFKVPERGQAARKDK